MVLLNPSYVVVYSVINMREQVFSTLSYDISFLLLIFLWSLPTISLSVTTLLNRQISCAEKCMY